MAGLDSYTKLLLHCDGDLTDSSGNGYDAAANGTVSFSSSPAKFGQSAYVASSGNYIAAPVNADMQFGTGAFTIDFWVYLTTLSGDNSFFELNYYYSGIYFNSTSTTLLPHYFNTGTGRSVAWTPAINTWYHIALVRDASGTVYLFLGGILLDSWTDAANLQPTIGTDNFVIGNAHHATSRTLDGYIDEFRVSKGVARWTADFDLPTAAYGKDYRLAGLAPQTTVARRGFVSLAGLADLRQDLREGAIISPADIAARQSVQISQQVDLRQDVRQGGLALSADIIRELFYAGLDARASVAGQRRASVAPVADITRPALTSGGGWADVTARHMNGLDGLTDLAGNRLSGVDAAAEIRAALHVGLDNHSETWTREAYAVYLDGEYLGDIPAEPEGDETNTLSLGELDDGTYTVTICPRGRFWRDTGCGKKLTVVVSGGVVSAVTLPAVESVGITYESGFTVIGWALPEAFGASSVKRFGLWYAAEGETPDTTLDPDDTVPAWQGSGTRYQAFRNQSSGAAQVVSICCLDASGNRGPAVTVDLPALADAPLSPANQRAEETV